MGAEGKMLTRAGWRHIRGGCGCCGSVGKDRGAMKALESAAVRREVEGHYATRDAEAALQAYDSRQELLEMPPVSPEGRWILEEVRRDDEAAMGAWDGVSDFYEDDESPAEILAAFERGQPVITMHPDDWEAAGFDKEGNPLPGSRWDGVTDFAWVDEPLADLIAATDREPDGFTAPPPGWTGPVR